MCSKNYTLNQEYLLGELKREDIFNICFFVILLYCKFLILEQGGDKFRVARKSAAVTNHYNVNEQRNNRF